MIFLSILLSAHSMHKRKKKKRKRRKRGGGDSAVRELLRLQPTLTFTSADKLSGAGIRGEKRGEAGSTRIE